MGYCFLVDSNYSLENPARRAPLKSLPLPIATAYLLLQAFLISVTPDPAWEYTF